MLPGIIPGTPLSAVVIGSGFAGLAAATFLAKDGWQVTVIEKNAGPGGRASQLKENGFILICRAFKITLQPGCAAWLNGFK